MSAMLKAVATLSTSATVRGIVVDPHGIEVPDLVPILDSHNVRNGCLGHLERAWVENDSLMGDLVFTGSAGRRAYDLIERGSLNGVSCSFQIENVAIFDIDGDEVDVEEAVKRGHADPDLILIAQRSILREVSITAMPADPGAFVRAIGIDAEAWRMIRQGEAELDRILRSDGVVIADNKRARNGSIYRPTIVMPPDIQIGEPEPIL
jgi:hypothetical protein